MESSDGMKKINEKWPSSTYLHIYLCIYLPTSSTYLPTYLPMMDPTLFPNSGFKKTIFNLFCSDQFRIRTPYAKKLALE